MFKFISKLKDVGNFKSKTKTNDQVQHDSVSHFPKHLCSLYLVQGFIRTYCAYHVVEINEICLLFFGYWAQTLIDFGDDEWFSTVIQCNVNVFKHAKRILETAPLTQYIDERYQILFGVISGFQWIKWKGFLVVNLQDKTVHELKAVTSKIGSFHLSLSEALECSNVQTDANGTQALYSRDGWLQTTVAKTPIAKKAGLIMTIPEYVDAPEYPIWREFEANLWALFCCGRLYHRQQGIKEQPIWKVLEFLFVVVFQKDHCRQRSSTSLTMPDLILEGTDTPPYYFSSALVGRHRGKFHKNDKYKGFRIERDCIAKITEYKKDTVLKCECFLYVDWGGGYWTMGGCCQKLYCAQFEMSNPNNQSRRPTIKLEFECVAEHQVRGRAMS